MDHRRGIATIDTGVARILSLRTLLPIFISSKPALSLAHLSSALAAAPRDALVGSGRVSIDDDRSSRHRTAWGRALVALRRIDRGGYLAVEKSVRTGSGSDR